MLNVALVIFALIKAINKVTNLRKKEEAKEEAPAKSAELATLEEIRDLLKKRK